MDDLISRQWLMECVEEGWIKFDTEKDKNKFIHLVRDTAPSAQPQRMRGRWMEFGYPWFKCSQCGAVREQGTFLEYYCPNCGADMRGTE